MKVMANVDSHPAETFSQRRLCAAPYGKLASVSSRIPEHRLIPASCGLCLFPVCA
jgi:hypothetical protein